MNMNPMQMLKMKGMFERFQQNHPRVLPFFQDASRRIQEGSVLELSVTSPDGRTITCNIKVKADDMELIRQVSEMAGQK